MNEKETWEMTETTNGGACDRTEDLVSYLYGEADTATAVSFEAHMQSCASCRTELAAFGQLRTSIGDWRSHALGSALSTETTASASLIASPARPASERKPSALAAIREFFSLSPVWMRAATAALGVVFCALVALTIAHYMEQPKTVTVERIVQVKPSEAELDEIVAARLRQKSVGNEEAVAATAAGNQPGPSITEASAPKNQPTPKLHQASNPNATRQSNLARNRRPGLKISPQESRDIARDLRLVASNDEEDLPRLSDLIEESNQ